MDKLVEKSEGVKKIFAIYKQMQEVVKVDDSTPFNNTELQLLRELAFAEMEGKKLISTQLATILGVTRSSVSQMVNKLEKQGVVYRMADDVDRKIAYVQMTDEAKNLCKAELEKWMQGFSQIVEAFGEEKLTKMLALLEEFVQTVARVNKEEE